MESFGLLVGHLLGDYVLQNDWMATNKSNPHPGPSTEFPPDGAKGTLDLYKWNNDWATANVKWEIGNIACTVHCLLYTLTVWACSFWWMPWWGVLACFVIHWPIDRFRLAKPWMVYVSGQKGFAEGPLAPWSIVIVDNTFHLLTLFVIGLLAAVAQQ